MSIKLKIEVCWSLFQEKHKADVLGSKYRIQSGLALEEWKTLSKVDTEAGKLILG